jgi:hypothetical protein
MGLVNARVGFGVITVGAGTGDADLGTDGGRKSVFFFWVRRRGRRLGTDASVSDAMGDWTSHTENARVFRVYLLGGPILIFWQYFRLQDKILYNLLIMATDSVRRRKAI